MSFWNKTVWWATVDRYSPGTGRERRGLNDLIGNPFLLCRPNVGLEESHYWSNNNNNFLKPRSCKGTGIRFYPSDQFAGRVWMGPDQNKVEGKNSWTRPNGHLCRSSVTKPKLLWVIIVLNEPLLCVWVGLCSSRTCRHSICLHAERFRRPTGIFHALYAALFILHKIIISSPNVCFFPHFIISQLASWR